MYDKIFMSVTSHALDPPLPCHKLSHFLGPLPLERDVLYERPLSQNQDYFLSSLFLLFGRYCNEIDRAQTGGLSSDRVKQTLEQCDLHKI